jgi:UDP-N-acetylglucosamine acyltransferase
VVGLRRAGFDDARRLRIRRIIKEYFFRGMNGSQALEKLAADFPGDPDAASFTAFIAATGRGIMPGIPLNRVNENKENEC